MVAARFAFALRPPVDDLVHGLKYEGWRELAPMMGDAMARLDLPWPPGTTGAPAVVAVPTTAGRLRARGYNQAGLLAEQLAGALDLPTVDALERIRGSSSQTALTPEARRRNVEGVFRLTPGARAVRGGAVLLVDDVLTTGATVSSAAECLARGGAGPVIVVTFARALDRGARVAA